MGSMKKLSKKKTRAGCKIVNQKIEEKNIHEDVFSLFIFFRLTSTQIAIKTGC